MEKKNKLPLILAVDDIPRNLQVLSMILSKEGYDIALASNGQEAINILENIKPDLILLDIMMPDIDGYQVADKVIKDESTSHIPIIFITGKADSKDIIKGFKHGAVDYITKPFNAIELLSRVKTHLTLKLSKDELKHKNKELEQVKQQLEENIFQKDKFFSIISHDLRGPFSGFLGLSDLLADEYDKLSGEEISEIGKTLNNAANRLFSLLENLLNWSRTQTGRMQFTPEKVNLNNIVGNNIMLQSQTAKNKQIDLSYSIPENTNLIADVNMLDTVLRNLISNAIKFTYKGGAIKIYSNEANDFLQITIEDNGKGMNEFAKESIFRIDSKFSTQGTNSESGTGLGLILCKELVEMHNGSIGFESEENVGTKFFFTIPKA